MRTKLRLDRVGEVEQSPTITGDSASGRHVSDRPDGLCEGLYINLALNLVGDRVECDEALEHFIREQAAWRRKPNGFALLLDKPLSH